MCQMVMLMRWTHEYIGAIERVAIHRIVIVERPVVGQHIPGIVDVKIGKSQSQREMDSCDARCRNVLGHELALWKPSIVLGKLCIRVWHVVRVDLLANLLDCAKVIDFHAAYV